MRLKVENLHVSYGSINVLKGISLEVSQGQITALIGANGAGKSTALMAICGILPVQDGQVLLEKRLLNRLRPDQIAAEGIVQVPEGRRIFSGLTVLENLQMGAYLRRCKKEIKKDIDYIFGLFPILAKRQNYSAGTLSGGEQQMLVIGRALMAKPKILLLDEPSLGLAPIMVRKIFDVLLKIKTEDIGILLVEQNARWALQTAGYGYVMENGKIVLAGQGRELLQNEAVQTAYIGRCG